MQQNTNNYSISKLKKKVSSLEEILKQIKVYHANKESHHKNRSDRLFQKMLNALSSIENKKVTHLSNQHKNLESIMKRLKAKSLFYQVEAMIIEDLFKATPNKKVKRSLSSSTPPEQNNLFNYSICKSETELNKLQNYNFSILKNDKVKFLSHVFYKVVKYNIDYLFNESIIILSSNCKTKTKRTLNKEVKHITTFLLCDNKKSKLKNISNSPKKINRFNVTKQLSKINYLDEIVKNGGDTNQNCYNNTKNVQNLLEHVKIINEKCDEHFIDDVTQSISQGTLNKKCESTLNSQSSMSQSIDDNVIDKDVANNKKKRLINIIKQSIAKFHENSKVNLHFFMTEPEIIIPINLLKLDSTFGLKALRFEDNFISECVFIRKSKYSRNDEFLIKVKKNRVIKQTISIPMIFCDYFDILSSCNNNMYKKDTRIIHIESFCHCFINPNINTFNFGKSEKRLSDSLITVNIIYNLIKGNELGCLNMIRRLNPLFNSQVKIIKEVRLTVSGYIDEVILK